MISIAWATGVITIPQSFLTHLGGTLYQLDVDDFRLALKDLEDDEAGIPWPKTHNHNTQVTLAGITFARQIEIIAPYRVVFEDGMYGVNVVGGNTNIADVLNRNSVSVNTQNSAGLILATVGGIDEQTVRDALTAQGYTVARAPKIDNLDVAISTVKDAVWSRVVDGTITAEQSIRLMNAILGGKASGAQTGTERFRDPSDTKDRVTSTVDTQGNRVNVLRDLT